MFTGLTELLESTSKAGTLFLLAFETKYRLII